MNKNTLAMIVIAIVVLGGGAFFLLQGSGTQTPSTPAAPTQPTTTEQVSENAVQIKNFAYNPKALTVKVGTTLTWTNLDLAGHSATADDNSFDTGVLSQGKSGTVTFDKAGTYSYHCTPHPNIIGTLIVE